MHPALLDSVLHAVGYAGVGDESGPVLPFSWNGVSLHARGASMAAGPRGEGRRRRGVDRRGRRRRRTGAVGRVAGPARPVDAPGARRGHVSTTRCCALEWVPLPEVAGRRATSLRWCWAPTSSAWAPRPGRWPSAPATRTAVVVPVSGARR